jgi:ATP-binding cassette subfamily B protein
MSEPLARSEIDGRHMALSLERTFKQLGSLLRSLPGSERARLRRCGWLSVLVALCESAATALLVPFLGVLAGAVPSALPAFAEGFVGRESGTDWFTALAIIIAALLLAAAGARLLLLKTKLQLEENAAHEIGSRIFERALGQPYAQFVRRNSSEIIAGMEKVRGLVSGVLGPAIEAILALIMGAIIAAALIAIAPAFAIILLVVLVPAYLLLSRLSQGRLRSASGELSETYTSRVKMVQEGLGGIRDIKIGRTEAQILARFRAIDARYRDAKVASGLIAKAPGLAVEGLALAALVLLGVVFVGRAGDAVALLPIIGAMAYGLRRLMPLWQQVYLLRSSLATYSGLLADVQLLLTLPGEPAHHPPLPGTGIAHRIELKDVGFAYEAGGEKVLSDISLAIAKGEAIGLTGPSGAGKSTLVDLISGLLLPTSGRIEIDGEVLNEESRARWQADIAHMPQTIFLLDDSVFANIAFGTPGAPDEMRVREAARDAEIADFVESLPGGYDTRVGERGVRLSGGQRQRIGLARALYRNPSFLVLDESTSALDHATEGRILASISRIERELGILMIAHRLSTLRYCDRVFEVDGGRLRELDMASSDRKAAS